MSGWLYFLTNLKDIPEHKQAYIISRKIVQPKTGNNF